MTSYCPFHLHLHLLNSMSCNFSPQFDHLYNGNVVVFTWQIY
jgi:hypothetical protein